MRRASDAGQLSLAGFDVPKATDRLFFAVFPDPATAARITTLAHQLRHDYCLKGEPLKSDRLHITLDHLGDYSGLPADVVAAGINAGDRVRCTSFRVAFNRLASFSSNPRNRPLVLQMSPVEEPILAMRRALEEQMAACGLARHVERRFVPHVTLLYDERLVAEQEISPLGWEVGDFALVHSLLGRTEHRILKRWSLAKALQD